MTWPDVFVGAVAVALVVWVLLFAACAPPPLPPESPITCTVALQRDH